MKRNGEEEERGKRRGVSGHHTHSCSGFHTEGGGAGIFLPQPQFPPGNLEIEYGYYCFVTDIKQQSCPR